MKAHIPNIITLLNLICGCVGIVLAFSGELFIAAYLIWGAAIFDFFDGFAARLLKVKSSIGKELDSLADMVSFGVLPSVIMYILIEERTDNTFLPYLAFLIAAFSALRLAKFNIDERQAESFIGLPTPANAFFMSAIPFILDKNFIVINDFLGAEGLIVICIIFSILLVSNISLFSLKFKGIAWQNNAIRYIFVAISGVLLLFLDVKAIPLIILLYLVLSVGFNLTSSTK